MISINMYLPSTHTCHTPCLHGLPDWSWKCGYGPAGHHHLGPWLWHSTIWSLFSKTDARTHSLNQNIRWHHDNVWLYDLCNYMTLGLEKVKHPVSNHLKVMEAFLPLYMAYGQCWALIFFEKSELRMGSCEQDYSWSVLFARPHEKHIGGKLGPQKQHRCFCEVTRESSECEWCVCSTNSRGGPAAGLGNVHIWPLAVPGKRLARREALALLRETCIWPTHWEGGSSLSSNQRLVLWDCVLSPAGGFKAKAMFGALLLRLEQFDDALAACLSHASVSSVLVPLLATS